MSHRGGAGSLAAGEANTPDSYITSPGGQMQFSDR